MEAAEMGWETAPVDSCLRDSHRRLLDTSLYKLSGLYEPGICWRSMEFHCSIPRFERCDPGALLFLETARETAQSCISDAGQFHPDRHHRETGPTIHEAHDLSAFFTSGLFAGLGSIEGSPWRAGGSCSRCGVPGIPAQRY